jgi:hypothetical protein
MSEQNHGQLDSALRHYLEGLAQSPDHIGLLHATGVVRAWKGKGKGGTKLLSTAAGLAPANAQILINLGNSWR